MADNISVFLNEVTEIEEKITNVRANIAKIQEFQSQILTSTSTTQEDATNKGRETLVATTRNLLIECKDRVKKLQLENARMSSDSNIGLREQRFKYLKTKLSNVLEEYHQAESEYMKQTKSRMERQYRVVNPNATQQEIDDYVSNPDSQPIFQQALSRTNEAKNAMAEVQKRHGDIKNIENTIAELAALFQELNLQVEAQDQTIVNVSDNVQDTVVKTEQAAQELSTATKLAKAARKKKWICLGIAILIIIVVVIVLIIQLPKINGGGDSKNDNKNDKPNNGPTSITSIFTAVPSAQ